MKPKILFMGTPVFAVPSLKALAEAGYNIIGAVTQPDRPKGRGRRPVPPPVKTCALEMGLEVCQPDRVRDGDFLETFRELSPDMVVLAAFGQILPREIIDLPRLGCLNVHPSLLPRYRGAAPINWSIINGDRETGVTIMLMDEGVDSGDILLQEEVAIDPDDTFDDLHETLSTMGAELLVRAIRGALDGTIVRTPQDPALVTLAPRLEREVGHIDWNDDPGKIVNLIRGLSSRPGAYSFFGDKKLKIFYAVAGEEKSSGEKEPGTPGRLMEAGLQIATRDGHVYLKDVQLEGKKRMLIEDFLRGNRLTPDDILE
ncbi:MAG: methionyl-tRNA formyltransferase [Deltaproteobacteria bacterium]|nr:methionyl-tRNA formyltransferase [Deltaproteobacteria bacterium]MBW2674141.1 methionyl-tRNA formyltransferase [Deltaproteobacteria bacterium]